MAGEPWLAYVPEEARPAYEGAGVHSLALGERAVLARLRTLEEEAFAAPARGLRGPVAEAPAGVPAADRSGGAPHSGEIQAVHPQSPGPDGPVRLPGPHSRRSGGGSALRPDSGLPGPWPPGSPGDVLPLLPWPTPARGWKAPILPWNSGAKDCTASLARRWKPRSCGERVARL